MTKIKSRATINYFAIEMPKQKSNKYLKKKKVSLL